LPFNNAQCTVQTENVFVGKNITHQQKIKKKYLVRERKIFMYIHDTKFQCHFDSLLREKISNITQNERKSLRREKNFLLEHLHAIKRFIAKFQCRKMESKDVCKIS
jgi:hypothetical protein